jgi:hypothetical protein
MKVLEAVGGRGQYISGANMAYYWRDKRKLVEVSGL